MILPLEAWALLSVGAIAAFLAIRFWQAVKQQEALLNQQKIILNQNKTLLEQNESLQKELQNTREALRICEGSK